MSGISAARVYYYKLANISSGSSGGSAPEDITSLADAVSLLRQRVTDLESSVGSGVYVSDQLSDVGMNASNNVSSQAVCNIIFTSIGGDGHTYYFAIAKNGLILYDNTDRQIK